MRGESGAGRVVGGLMVVHLAAGLMAPYIVLKPVLAEPGFLAQAAAHAGRVHTAVMLLFLDGALTLAIALAGLSVFRRRGDRPALLLLALAAVNLALHAVENGTLLSMLSLSQRAAGAGADAGALEVVGAVVGTARRWAHFTHLFVLGSWIFTLHAVLWRSGAVPRVLAGLGMMAAVLQVTGVPLPALLGLGTFTPMAMPLAPVYVAVGLRLLVKGFEEGAEDSARPPLAA